MEEMESSFSYLGVKVRGNEIDTREHLFFSIFLKSQIFIPLKLRGIGGGGGNEIRFNEFFTKTPKILLYI